MQGHRRHCVVLGMLGALLAGCATPNLVVPIDTAQVLDQAETAVRRATIEVIDIRREANLERSTIGGVTMGKITLEPPAAELVQTIVQAKADRVLASRGTTETQTVLCGIRTFEITTPATPLYWDVNVKVELVLRVHGRDRNVSGVATERTFVWPSEALIRRVSTEALRQVGSETEHALTELFAAPR